MDAAEALDALRRDAVLWLVRERRTEAVIRAACDALAAGADGEQLRALGGVSVRLPEGDAEAEVLIHAALAEQGRPLPERGSAEAQVAAATVWADEVLRGTLPCREFAAWAHRAIGHDGADELQRLVELDDEYDMADDIEGGVQALDEQLRQCCRDLLAGRPVPASPRPQPATAPPSRWRRLRRRLP